MKRFLLVGLLVLGLSASAQAATTMVNGLGGVAGYGENQLAANDDFSTAFLNLSSVFTGGMNFFGTNYSGLYLNNNGNVTFGAPLATYTPFNLSGATGLPIIAPFFADVDTRGAGHLYYDLDTVNHVFTATWDAVGYYPAQISPVNSFQLRLSDQGTGNFGIEFRYQNLGWTLGSASGTTHARAGYNSGSGADFSELSASGNPAAMLNLVNTSNVGVAGLYQWNVNNGVVVVAPPVTGVPEPSTLLLLSSGLLGTGGLGFIRRKFKR